MIELFGRWADQVLLLGLTTTRFSVAFVALPTFSNDTVPSTVRNSIYVSFGLIVFVMVPPVSAAGLTTTQWITLFGKEAFVGLIIGFFFGSILWAMELAGNYIDTKIGATIAQIVDPMSGHQTSLTGEFLARLANYIFLMSGGFLVLVNTVLLSYSLWPVDQAMPDLKHIGLNIFTDEFSRLMTIALLIAAPSLVVLATIDWGMGLLNRFAQQLNVFSLAMSIKAWVGQFIIVMMLGTLVDLVATDIAARGNIILTILQALHMSSFKH